MISGGKKLTRAAEPNGGACLSDDGQGNHEGDQWHVSSTPSNAMAVVVVLHIGARGSPRVHGEIEERPSFGSETS